MYCSFFSFFLPFFFLLCHKAWGILVPRLEVRPELQWWELRVQTAGLTDNLRAQGISIGVRPPRSPHLSTKTQLYPSTCKLQCWTTQDKQPVRHEYKTTHTHTHTHTHKKRQKNMSQTKEQGKNLQNQINEDEIGNLPEKNSE